MSQTVFILGAGASAEVNLPVGDKLTTEIGKLLNFVYSRSGERTSGDALIDEALRGLKGSEHYFHAARRVSEAMSLAASIDNYLDAHREDKHISLCGKLGIVRAILTAEYDSALSVDPRRPDIPPNLPGIRASWFRLFWQLLCEGCTAAEFAKRSQSVAFVIFNYDRCLQHFLYHAARAYYGLSADRAAALINAMHFYHPYGSVGWLPWQHQQTGVVGYGSNLTSAELLVLATRINTFTESAQPDMIGPIRDAIAAASRIVFLGFAYHRQNLDLLWPDTVKLAATGRRYYGTAYEISDSDVDIILDEITARTGIDRQHHGRLPQIKCAKLFHEYKQSLSML
jgi:hypothetical protein